MAAVGLLALAGCQKSDEIEHYVVTKPEVRQQEVFGDKPPADVAASLASEDRMVAAIVPHGEKLWFFKVVGPDESVVESQEALRKFLGALKFDSPDADPSWTLPDGWSQKPGDQMRLATILMGGAEKKPLELTVSSLPGPAKDNKAALWKALLDNVNRWRGQFGLRPVGKERLTSELQTINVAGDTAYVIAITGHFQGGPMMSPMAGGPRGDQSGQGSAAKIPPSHPPIATPDDKTAGNTPNDSSDRPLAFKKPDGWRPAASTGFSALSFSVTDGDQRASITATALGGSDLSANVNRWRGQLGLDPLDESQLQTAVKQTTVGGDDASYVDLAGASGAIVGVIVKHGERQWFFKLQGDKSLVEREKPRFDTFLKSIEFKE